MNRVTQTTSSCFTAGKDRMMTNTVLANRIVRYTGANGVNQEARCHGFRPACFDMGSGERHRNGIVPRHLGLAHHHPTDYSDEVLRNRRFRAGSLLLYREYDTAAT